MINKVVLSLVLLLVITSVGADPNAIVRPSETESKPLDLQPKYCGKSGCERSFRAILELAKNGSPRAKMIAGLMYLNGIGTEQNDRKTRRHLMAAARAGFEFSQYAVGVLHIEGKVFERDVDKGNFWLKKAALGGYKPAIKLIMQNHAAGDEESLRRLKEIDFSGLNENDRHIVITTDYLTLDDYVDYLKKTTNYARKSSTGSRIRGLHCGETSLNCRTINGKTITGEFELFRMLAPPGWF